MLFGERVNHHVLDGIQVLEFIDENGGVTASHFLSNFLDPHQLGRLEHEHVKVDEVSLRQEVAVSLIENAIVVLELVAAKPMSRESRQTLTMPAAIAFDAAEHSQLIIFVGDSESRLEPHLCAEFAQELCAERVNRSALDSLCVGAEVLFEARGDLAGGFVGESKSADSRWIEAALLDEKTDSLDEAVSLSCARPCQHEKRLRLCLDRSSL